MANPASQRAYRAPCPGCGAPVSFASAQSTHAVCAYCQSTVVRDGDKLARIGKMAELFDDHSPLQLQASGIWRAQAFTLVGRLQYKYAEGTWTEWYALLADGSSAYLSEDNGAYVFAVPQTVLREFPPAERFQPGASITLGGQAFSVASNIQVMLMSAQGELPHLPETGKPYAMVELRSQGGASQDAVNTGGSVLSIDYSSQPPTVTLGQSVLLDDLKLSGLHNESVKSEGARQFNCPNCGAAVVVTLATSQSITCGACNSLIDLSQGIGGELKHALQEEPAQPLIALGTQGKLEGVDWQVVGFQHRMGVDPGDPDEHFGWEEYLLYNQKRGFCFLVDSSEGWSLVRPTTGAPEIQSNGRSASYLGKSYQFKERYTATTTYTLGEFYWQVTRGQSTQNSDFASGTSLLSMEQSPTEVVWSVGSKIDSALVAKAFKLEDKKELLKRSDVGPVSASAAMSVRTLIIIFLILLLFSFLISRCSSCDPAVENCSSGTSRSSGGSFGGFSGGGGHK
jgi:ribosomal protein S27E